MMLANFFGKSKPVNFILILVLFILYYILFLFKYDFDIIDKGLLRVGIGGFFQILLLFLLFNFIIVKNKLTRDNSYAFLFLVMSFGLLPNSIVDYEIVFINLILLLFLRKVYSLRSPKAIFSKLFDSGLWLGVSFLFEPFTIVYFVFIYAAIFLFLKFTIRTILIPILGLATPLFLYYTYCFYTDQMLLFEHLFEFEMDINLNFYKTTFYSLIFSLFGVVVILSIAVRSSKIFSVSNRFKRSWTLLLFHLLLSIGFVSLLKTHSGTELIAVVVPTTIIIANWIESIAKKWFADFVLLFFLVFSFAIHFIA